MTPKHVITQQDVARKAGVNRATVSLSLSGHKSIPQSTRERIVSIAREMGYAPNALARGLRSQKSNLLGMIADLTWGQTLLKRIALTARLAQERGYEMMLFHPSLEDQALAQTVQSMISHQAAGLFIAASSTSAKFEYLDIWRKLGRPVISLLPWPDDSKNVIDTDRKEGWRRAVHYLASLGHRRIVMSLGALRSQSTSKARVQGWRQGMRECGLDAPETHILTFSSFNQAEAGRVMRAMLKLEPRPTAFIATSDDYAAYCIQQLLSMGVRIPQDLSVMGFDDSLAAQFSPVPLTTLAQPVEAMSKLGIDRFVDMIEGRGPMEFEPVLFPPELVIRQSTGPVKQKD